MPEKEQIQVNERALDLYFGDQWRSKIYKTPGSLKFSDPRRGAAEISNATMVIVRLLRSAADAGEPRKVKEALGVAYFYVSALRDGGHFRGVVSLCEDIAGSLAGGEYGEELFDLNFRYGQALRMVGEGKRAVAVLQPLVDRAIQKRTKQGILLNLALCYESAGDVAQAVSTAKAAIEIDAESHQALHARVILTENGGGTPAETLSGLEAQARAKKAHMVANNIAISRSRELPLSDVSGIAERLQPVLITAAQAGDHYNLLRARLRLAKSMQAGGSQLTNVERSWLLGAYQYLYNQRLESMFDECHQLLWTLFEKAREGLNKSTDSAVGR